MLLQLTVMRLLHRS